MTIVAVAFVRAEVTPQSPLPQGVPLARRMTLLQRAAIDALRSLEAAVGAEAFSHLAREIAAPLHFASEYAEVDSIVAVAGQVLRRELPCSPTAFQHSVHNAAPGYLTIVQGLRNPASTVSAGWLSFDKSLYWAFHEIRAQGGAAFVFHGCEQHPRAPLGAPAVCEGLVLAEGALAQKLGLEPVATLDDVSWTSGVSAGDEARDASADTAASRIYESDSAAYFAGLALDSHPRTFHRNAISLDGDAVISAWSMNVHPKK